MIKKCPTPLAFREMQIKTTLGVHQPNQNRSHQENSSKCWMNVDKKVWHCRRECKLAWQPQPKITPTVWHSPATPGYVPRGLQVNTCRGHLNISVHCSSIPDSHVREPAQVSSNRGMDNTNVPCVYCRAFLATAQKKLCPWYESNTTGDNCVTHVKPASKRQIAAYLSYLWFSDFT